MAIPIHSAISPRFKPPNLSPLSHIPLRSFPPRRRLAVKCEDEKSGDNGIMFVNTNAFPRAEPPDWQSDLLDQRIVCIDNPLDIEFAEEVMAQLMHLAMMDPNATITLYIDSTGTALHDGSPVALECDGFGMYEFLMMFDMKIRTVNIGIAMGQACLLLAAGTKGHRYTYPHTIASIPDPHALSTELLPASDIFKYAKEAIVDKETLAGLLALHTGNSVEDVLNEMRSSHLMDVEEAVKFGIVDKILRDGLKLEDIFEEDEVDEEEDEEEDEK